MSYHLEYMEKPGKLDEVVEQDGVEVVIDSKALFSIIGSEMDWKEDGLRCAVFASCIGYILSISSLFAQRKVHVQEPERQGRLRVWRVLHRRLIIVLLSWYDLLIREQFGYGHVRQSSPFQRIACTHSLDTGFRYL